MVKISGASRVRIPAQFEEGELEELQESVRFAEEEKLIAMQQLCQEIANMVNAGDVLAAINTITEHNDKTIRIVSETNALYSMNDSFRKQDMDSSVASASEESPLSAHDLSVDLLPDGNDQQVN